MAWARSESDRLVQPEETAPRHSLIFASRESTAELFIQVRKTSRNRRVTLRLKVRQCLGKPLFLEQGSQLANRSDRSQTRLLYSLFVRLRIVAHGDVLRGSGQAGISRQRRPAIGTLAGRGRATDRSETEGSGFRARSSLRPARRHQPRRDGRGSFRLNPRARFRLPNSKNPPATAAGA